MARSFTAFFTSFNTSLAILTPWWRLFLSLALVVTLSLLLWRSPPESLKELLVDDTEATRFPTIYYINPRTTQFSAEGLISYRLNADLMNFFDTEDATQPEVTINEPLITFYDKDSPTTPLWVISATSGEGNKQQDRLLLTGNVVLEQTRPSAMDSRLQTAAITLHPKRRYAETDKPVTITGPDGRVTATGARFFFDDQRIELLSNVKSRYQLP